MHIPLLSYYNTFTAFPASEVPGGSWYIVHFTGPNKLRSIGVIEKSFQVLGVDHRIWIPCKKILVYKSSNLIEMNEPIYYDYIFVNTVMSWDLFEKLKKDVKNIKILCVGDDPYKLTAEELKQVKIAHGTFNESISEASVKSFKYRIGDFVRISYGPFSEMTGEICDVNNTQVVLNITFFGKEVKFFIPIDKSHYMIKAV